MARLYQRKKIWYVDYSISGRRIREAVGTSKKVAESVLKQREAQIIRGEFELSRPAEMMILELVEKFLHFIQVNRRPHTYERYVQIMEHFSEFLSKHPQLVKTSDLMPGDFEAYKAWRVDQINKGTRSGRVHRNTINLELDTIRTAFNYGIKFHGLRQNPAKGIDRFRVVKEEPRVLSRQEIHDVLKNSKGMLHNVLVTALFTGMRKGELQNLRWQNVDLANRIIHIRPVGSWVPKTWEVRDIPIHQSVYQIFKRLPRNSEFVFASANGRMIKNLRRGFVRVCDRVGIQGATFHDLRHTFATYFLRVSDIKTLAATLGHRKLETTLIYLHSGMHTMRADMQRLDFEVERKSYGTNLAQTKKSKTLSADFPMIKKGVNAEERTRTSTR